MRKLLEKYLLLIFKKNMVKYRIDTCSKSFE